MDDSMTGRRANVGNSGLAGELRGCGRRYGTQRSLWCMTCLSSGRLATGSKVQVSRFLPISKRSKCHCQGSSGSSSHYGDAGYLVLVNVLGGSRTGSSDRSEYGLVYE